MSVTAADNAVAVAGDDDGDRLLGRLCLVRDVKMDFYLTREFQGEMLTGPKTESE